jgi:hypothetical protein
MPALVVTLGATKFRAAFACAEAVDESPFADPKFWCRFSQSRMRGWLRAPSPLLGLCQFTPKNRAESRGFLSQNHESKSVFRLAARRTIPGRERTGLAGAAVSEKRVGLNLGPDWSMGIVSRAPGEEERREADRRIRAGAVAGAVGCTHRLAAG